MLVSLEWLRDYVDIPEKINPGALANELTLKTAEVEGYLSEKDLYKNMVAGQVVSLRPHPGADKLRLADTSIGKETVQIVCGGKNLREGMYVAVAKPGAKVKWHGGGDYVELEKAKIRGEESNGMICASNEIGIDNPDEGPEDIMDLTALKPEVGTPLAEVLGKTDVILEFDNKALTHRPDLWGHYGIAREIAAITNKKFKHLKPKIKIPVSSESVKVSVKNFDLCPRYCGLIINNVRVGESPEWIKRRLKATGHGVHNNIVDVTNYVMHELGQPMHAFDKGFIKGGIIVRTANSGEKMTTLDDKTRSLDSDILVIADNEKAVAIAGVMGGQNSEINENTTSIILESANFSGASVRRTSVKLGLRTDSVQRFEKSLDPFLAEAAIKRAAELILEICPNAVIAGPISDEKKFNEKPVKVDLNIKKVQSKIGVDIEPEEMKNILEKLEFEVEDLKKGVFSVTVPSFRASKDIDIEDDLIEEIARMYGYENIAATLPKLPTRLPIENMERFKKHRLRELLSYGLNFDEVYNYSFYGDEEIKRCQMTEAGHLKLLNYLSEDQTHLRISLVPNLLKSLQLNLKNFDDVRIYEIGHTYKEIGQYYPLEQKEVAGAIMANAKGDAIFYEIKGVVETILKRFSVATANMVKGVKNVPYAHPVKAISYLSETGQTVAKVFVLHPLVAKTHELEKKECRSF